MMQYFFFVHAGARIGTLKGNVFTPTQHLYWHLEDISSIPILTLIQEHSAILSTKKQLSREEEDGWYSIKY
ncbi:MAG: hypothetical protein WCK88_02370 [bacterium]